MEQIRGYAFRQVLDIPYEAAVERVTAALQAEGFGLLTQIDLRATFERKLDKPFRRYVILGACNPTFAYEALAAELDVGLFLPGNVIVYETDHRQTCVAAINPIAMLDVIPGGRLERSAGEVSSRIAAAIASLGRDGG